MSASQGPTERVISASRRMLGSLFTVAETRLRLAVLELEIERDRLLATLLLITASLILLSFAIGMLILLVVAFYWDSHRFIAIGVCAITLLLLSTLLAYSAKRLVKRRKLMESTLNHLAQDRRTLETPREPS